MILSTLTFIYLFILSFFPVSTWSHGIIGEPVSFNPSKLTSDSERTISNLIFRKLVNVDYKTGEVQKDLLESYKVIQDGSVYELKMKKNQYWQDGVPINADDILYTASVSSNLKEVSSDKIDDYTVRFTLPSSYSPFLSILNIPILPAHLADNNSDTYTIGSGDYRIVRVRRDRASIREVILMSANQKLPFQKLSVKFYKNEDDLRLSAKQFEVNSFLFNKQENFEKFNSEKTVFYSRAYLLIFNTTASDQDRDFRKNVAKSIDLNKVIDVQEYYNAVIPFGPFSGTWAASDSFEPVTQFSPVKIEKAKKYILLAPKVREARLIADSIKEQLKVNSGLNVSVEYVESENLIKEIEQNKYDMVLLAQEYGIDPDRYVFWHSSQNKGGLNYSNLSAVRIDKSLEEGRKEQDIEKRKSHYNIFQSVYSEEYPAIFILHPTQYFYYSINLEKPELSKMYYPYEVFDYVSEWKLKKNPKIF